MLEKKNPPAATEGQKTYDVLSMPHAGLKIKEPLTSFDDALTAAGLVLNGPPVADGRLHR